MLQNMIGFRVSRTENVFFSQVGLISERDDNDIRFVIDQYA